MMSKMLRRAGQNKRGDPVLREKAEFQKGTLLFHPSHGPVTVKEILRRPELQGDGWCYHLKPLYRPYAGTSFFVLLNRIRQTGFHPVLSPREAKEILEYLKRGERKSHEFKKDRTADLRSLMQENTPWAFARLLVLLSPAKKGKYAWDERVAFKQAVEGLVQELAFVMGTSVAGISNILLKNLCFSSQCNPWIKGELAHVR